MSKTRWISWTVCRRTVTITPIPESVGTNGRAIITKRWTHDEKIGVDKEIRGNGTEGKEGCAVSLQTLAMIKKCRSEW